jgi:hypothetical protein
MSDFKPGTKVHVEFDAIVETPREYDYIKASSGGLHANSDYGYGFLKLRDVANSLYHYVWAGPMYDDDERNIVTAIVSPDWEKHGGPKVGDIWEANGREYFAYKSFGDITLYPVDDRYLSSAGHTYYISEHHDEFAALNPRLVRRRGEVI